MRFSSSSESDSNEIPLEELLLKASSSIVKQDGVPLKSTRDEGIRGGRGERGERGEACVCYVCMVFQSISDKTEGVFSLLGVFILLGVFNK